MDQPPKLILQSVYELQTLIGQEIAQSDWISLTQDRIDAFAEVTGDKQWIHVDTERAKQESSYGTTIAHGFLTLSLLSEMMRNAIQIRDAGMTINYGLNRVRFPAAVLVGSRIRARFSVQAFKTEIRGVEVTFLVVVERENVAKPCCVAEWILHYSC
jgi:acyl dehydratase